MNADERTAVLEAIYARVPDPHCKGLCVDDCTAVPMSVHEARRLRRNGTPLERPEEFLERMGRERDPRCAALVNGRCSVYEMRPMICRIFGAVEDLTCDYGCVPDGGYLTRDEAFDLMAEVIEAGGGFR